MIGKIHSYETFGTVDGPGIRFVIFMQGCCLKCKYCHNRDTWSVHSGKMISVEELVKEVIKYKSYMDSSGGGVTVSGGEPLLQTDFICALFKELKKHNIHTAIDTAGSIPVSYEIKELLKYTDLVLFDVKHLTEEGYKEMTGIKIDESLKFLEACKKCNTKIWIRQVVVPGMTDSEEYISSLGEFIKSLNNVEKVELLPYHLLGVNKYENMGIRYRLDGVPAMDKDKCKELYKLLNL